MHETMVAQNLLAVILAEAEKQEGKPTTAKISCGLLNAINDEVLCFAFEAIAKGTACAGIRLEVEHKPLQGQCKNCRQSFDIEFSQPSCPTCKGKDFELLPDVPLVLETIEFSDSS